jgi:hypothetical protein
MSQQSTLNSSTVPLLPGRAFLGQYEEVLFFASINIQFYTDSPCEIVLYQTSDRIFEITETIPYTSASTLISISRPVLGSFFKIVVRNIGELLPDTPSLSLQTIYKAQPVQTPAPLSQSLYGTSISAGGVTPAIFNYLNYKSISIFGNTLAATVLTLELSADGIEFYDTQYTYTIATAGDYGFTLSLPFSYFRIKSSAMTSKLVVNVTLA